MRGQDADVGWGPPDAPQTKLGNARLADPTNTSSRDAKLIFTGLVKEGSYEGCQVTVMGSFRVETGASQRLASHIRSAITKMVILRIFWQYHLEWENTLFRNLQYF